MFAIYTVGVTEVLIKGLPEQTRISTVDAGGGMQGSSLWGNSLALHSLLKESKTHKRQLLKEKLFFLELVNSLFIL